MRTTITTACLLAALAFAACGQGGDQPDGGQPDGTKTTGMKPARPAGKAMAAFDRGLDFLKSAAKDGNYEDPGLTALAATAFLGRPGGVRPADDEFVSGLLGYVAGFQKGTGGIYDKMLANYTTCAAIMALSEAPGGKYEAAVKKAADFVSTLQMESGGIGYSDHHPGEPDLSNTQFGIEALRHAGVKKDDPRMSKALAFLQSLQNRSESNDAKYEMSDGRIVTIGDDGGAFYKPGESKAGFRELPDGTVQLRSYGSMTYALLKCYLMAGLTKDDPRVKAAVGWIRNNFTLEENPGFEAAESPKAPQQGYYYYLFTMAKALELLGEKTIKDSDGIDHDWRREMRTALLERQREDGSWVNENAERWMEGNPVLATSYALTALSCCSR